MPRPGKAARRAEIVPVEWTSEGGRLLARCERRHGGVTVPGFDVHVTSQGVLLYAPLTDDGFYTVDDADGARLARVDWRVPAHVDLLPADVRAVVARVHPGPFPSMREVAAAHRAEEAEEAKAEEDGDDEDVEGD